MRWPKFARLNLRLERFLETESHEYTDAIERHRRDRDEKERQIDLYLFKERREGSDWLENREIRMSAMVQEQQRALISARLEIRKRLGLKCPALLSDAQLSKLEETMLRSVRAVRQGRRDDYERRAHAAGVQVRRSEHRDAAQYGDLEALVRREVRQLVLARSLGRTANPPWTAVISLAKGLWKDPVLSGVLSTLIAGGLVALITAALLRYRGWWSTLLR